ncbi:pB117L [African swine fever virus]|uniref:PB117L n=1 Tax=African swine fever virus TaxID=10497 RepID=A0A894KS37_ASF|nr:pB117L [African swine fever virus]
MLYIFTVYMSFYAMLYSVVYMSCMHLLYSIMYKIYTNVYYNTAQTITNIFICYIYFIIWLMECVLRRCMWCGGRMRCGRIRCTYMGCGICLHVWIVLCWVFIPAIFAIFIYLHCIP